MRERVVRVRDAAHAALPAAHHHRLTQQVRVLKVHAADLQRRRRLADVGGDRWIDCAAGATRPAAAAAAGSQGSDVDDLQPRRVVHCRRHCQLCSAAQRRLERRQRQLRQIIDNLARRGIDRHQTIVVSGKIQDRGFGFASTRVYSAWHHDMRSQLGGYYLVSGRLAWHHHTLCQLARCDWTLRDPP